MTIVLFKDVPVGPIPTTPITPNISEDTCPIARDTLFHYAKNLGVPVGYKQEQNGRLIQNVVPNPKTEYSQISSSSKTTLALHTETAFHPYKPDYIMLLCLRGDPKAFTTYAQLQDILPELDDICIALLSQPLFETSIDESFRSKGEPDTVVTTTILGIKDGRPTMCYDKSVMRGTTVASQDALEEFGRAVEKHTKEIALVRGDLLIIDNSNTVHGRKPFQASYDGTDRWVQRLLVRSYNSPLSPDLEMCPTTGYPVITKYTKE
jgi:L-asparagine oxygenase